MSTTFNATIQQTATTYHEAHEYVQNPIHPLTVCLIGAGGTGCRMLTHLALMNQALIGLGRKGLHVTVYDDDIVSASNIARQLYSPSDIGLPKSAVIVQRTNRFYGTDWRYKVERITGAVPGNIIITCVDTKSARRVVERSTFGTRRRMDVHEEQNLYWLDCGNSKDTGQVILSTRYKCLKGSKQYLPGPSELYPRIFKGKEDNAPSCSVAEALAQQDLFINPTIALIGAQLLFRLINERRVDNQGAFVNLSTLAVRKIPLPARSITEVNQVPEAQGKILVG